ncbi:hypothetical protein Tco_0761576 [Tanacetum coccineum]
MPSPNFHNPAQLGYPQGPSKDEAHMFLHPHSSEPQMENMMGADHVQKTTLTWPNGLSFFSALTGRTDDTKLLFNPDGLGNNPGHEMKNPNDFLSLDNTNSDHNMGKVDHNKYKRSFTLPARMATSSCSLDHTSDMAEDEIQANMALMAFTDSEVSNDKSCSKSCLQNYEALKKQYDDLLVKLDDTGFKAATYKRGHKEYLIGLLRTELEKVKEEKEGFEFKIAKFEKSSKDLD